MRDSFKLLPEGKEEHSETTKVNTKSTSTMSQAGKLKMVTCSEKGNV